MVNVTDPNGNDVQTVIEDNKNGSYFVLFTPLRSGIHEFQVKIFGIDVKDSPLKICVMERKMATQNSCAGAQNLNDTEKPTANAGIRLSSVLPLINSVTGQRVSSAVVANERRDLEHERNIEAIGSTKIGDQNGESIRVTPAEFKVKSDHRDGSEAIVRMPSMSDKFKRTGVTSGISRAEVKAEIVNDGFGFGFGDIQPVIDNTVKSKPFDVHHEQTFQSYSRQTSVRNNSNNNSSEYMGTYTGNSALSCSNNSFLQERAQPVAMNNTTPAPAAICDKRKISTEMSGDFAGDSSRTQGSQWFKKDDWRKSADKDQNKCLDSKQLEIKQEKKSHLPASESNNTILQSVSGQAVKLTGKISRVYIF